MSWLRRAARRLRRQRLSLVYHPDYGRALPGIPMDPRRADRIVAFLEDEGIASARDRLRPIPVSLNALLRVHDPDYVAALDRQETVTHVFGMALRGDDRQAALDLQRLAAGGTILALRTARRTSRVVVNLGGGFHHATPSAGMAFCLFNDVAVAIAHLRHYGFTAPILVIDLDLHDGNGTRAAFAEDPTVYTYSVHNNDWEPTGGVASTAVALGTGVDDATYLSALRDTLPPVIAAHGPALVVYVAGTDPAADDRLGDWRITPDGMLARSRYVIETVRELAGEIPVGIVLGGGYGRASWRYTARFLSWLALGRPLEPPGELEAVLRRFRERAVRPYEQEDEGWGLTEADLYAIAPGAGQGQRVLGAFSKHGIELSLERAGFLDELRHRGFAHPTVDVVVGSELGQTIRVYGDADRSHTVMELRVNRSGRTVPGMEVLYVEWLMLQDPRAEFTDQTPRLPGQDHPGLGLLREVIAWLVVLCETLGLDGMAFVPSQYYMAVLGRHHMHFVNGEAGARFAALHDALRHCSLLEATRALEEHRVVDRDTGEAVTWEAPIQVYPVSDRMRRFLEDRELPRPRRYRVLA